MSNDYFDTDGEYKQQLMKELIEIVGQLGWNIAVPDFGEDEDVPGLVIGEPEYIDKILEILEDADT